MSVAVTAAVWVALSLAVTVIFVVTVRLRPPPR